MLKPSLSYEKGPLLKGLAGVELEFMVEDSDAFLSSSEGTSVDIEVFLSSL